MQFAAARVRSPSHGDFWRFIRDKSQKIPFAGRASHDAQLLCRPSIAPMRPERKPVPPVPIVFSESGRRKEKRLCCVGLSLPPRGRWRGEAVTEGVGATCELGVTCLRRLKGMMPLRIPSSLTRVMMVRSGAAQRSKPVPLSVRCRYGSGGPDRSAARSGGILRCR